MCVVVTGRCGWVRVTVTTFTTVIEYQQIAFSRQSLRDHVEMMLTDDPSQFAKFFRLGKIRSDLPYDLSGFLADDRQNIGVSCIEDQVVRMESLISCIIPFVLSENGYAVDMHPVTTGFSVKSRITEQNIFGSFIKIKFFKMIRSTPAPQDISFPVYFDDLIIDQFFIGNLMIVYIFMCQDDGISTVGFRFAARIIISDGISFSLVIVMLSCLPGRFFSRICDQLRVIEFPDDISVIIHLHQIQLILICIFSTTFSGSSHDIPTRKDLVRESAKTCPQIHFVSVHIDQKCSFCGWIDGVAVIRFLFVIH